MQPARKNMHQSRGCGKGGRKNRRNKKAPQKAKSMKKAAAASILSEAPRQTAVNHLF